MSELKPGDKVWISGTLEVFADGYGIRGIEDEPPMIPDVPNLASVARVLAENPEMGDAVQSVVNLFGGIHNSWVSSDNIDGITDVDTDLLQLVCDHASEIRALANALNGGPE